MECRGSSPMGRRRRAPHDPHLDPVAAHVPDGAARPDQRADGADPGARGRRRRWFGLKNGVAREDVAVVAASIDLGRPVKWIEDRLEHLASGGHAREEMADVEAAVTADGRAPRAPDGRQAQHGRLPERPVPGRDATCCRSRLVPGPHQDRGHLRAPTAVFSNKGTYVAYRGPWATGDFLRERMLDVIARELGLDPIDMRRRNYVYRDEPPLAMLTGQPFIGVTTQRVPSSRRRRSSTGTASGRRRAARAEGRYLGLGMASYLEAAPGPKVPGQPGGGVLGDESAHISLEDDGTSGIVTRQQPHGQGHETTLAQVAADELGVPFEDVACVSATPTSRRGAVGPAAAGPRPWPAAPCSTGPASCRQKVLSLAADVLEASEADLEIASGVISVRGTPECRRSPLRRAGAHRRGGAGPAAGRPRPGLTVTPPSTAARAAGRAAPTAASSRSTSRPGTSRILRYLVVEDCGELINPAIVDGQIPGGVAQGIGAVLFEHAAYDDDGQLLAGVVHGLPGAHDDGLPPIEIDHMETVPTDPEVNSRGVGEGGMIVAPARHHQRHRGRARRRSASRSASSTCRRRGSSSSLGTVRAGEVPPFEYAAPRHGRGGPRRARRAR